MMKRKILAAVIPALLAAATANAAEIYNKDGNKLDLYGKAVGRHVWTTTGDSKNADQTYAQIGFKGETQINTDLTGFGQWEYRTKADRAEGEQQNSNLVRLAFAGLKYAEVGSIDYGRNYGIVYDVESYTDMAPYFSGETWGGAYTDNYMTSRAGGLLTYRNSDFFGLVDGLSFGIQYQGKNQDNHSINSQNGDGVGYTWHMSSTALASPQRTATASVLTISRIAMVMAIAQNHGPLARNMMQTTSTWLPYMLKPAI